MSFRIFAAGSRRFRYERNNNLDGDDFAAAQVLAIFQTTQPNVRSVATDAAGAALPSASIVDLAAAVARMEFIHLIDLSVTSLAMKASEGAWIFVSCRKTHLAWPDTMASARYDFEPGDSPGREFFSAIRPALAATDFDTWGTLAGLSRVLAAYDGAIEANVNPRLSIQLTR